MCQPIDEIGIYRVVIGVCLV